jgi:hypothetical protein
VRALQEHPRAAKVQFRVACIDGAGRPLGRTLPLERDLMENGEVPRARRRFRHYLHPPGSGNAYPAWVLQRLLPVPEARFRICPDMYLAHLSIALGEIVSIQEVGAHYRVHGGNNSQDRAAPDLAKLREHFLRVETICEKQRALDPAVASLGTLDLWSLDMLAWRALSRKLSGGAHPFREGLMSLCARGVRGAATYPGVRAGARLRYAAWFVMLPVLPPSVCWRMAMWWRRHVWDPLLRPA